jgi:SAM-dependent methyltransferase
VWLAAAGLDRGVAAATNWVPALLHDLHLPQLAAWNWLAVERLHWLVWLAPVALAAWCGLHLWRGHQIVWHGSAVAVLGAIVVVLVVILGRHAWKEGQDAVAVARNFYGVLSVWEYDKTDPTRHYYLLQHGQITHGLQFAAPALARRPSSYYTSRSGVGLAVTNLPQQPGRTVAVVGLGTGTLAAYGRKGDRFRFYEINPDVERVARKHFSYLGDCEAKVDVVLGDARLAMEREPPQHFDLLALDAFSGDAIPVHLLTREAFEVYLRHLKPGGVIAVHISNRYLNLAPVVANLASHFKLRSATISVEEDSSGDGEDDGGEPRWWDYSSTWVLLTRDAAFLDQTAIAGAASKPETADKKIPLWTDDYTSLYPVLQ